MQIWKETFLALDVSWNYWYQLVIVYLYSMEGPKVMTSQSQWAHLVPQILFSKYNCPLKRLKNYIFKKSSWFESWSKGKLKVDLEHLFQKTRKFSKANGITSKGPYNWLERTLLTRSGRIMMEKYFNKLNNKRIHELIL